MRRTIILLVLCVLSVVLSVQRLHAAAAVQLPKSTYRRAIHVVARRWEPLQPIHENWPVSEKKLNYLPRSRSDFLTRSSRMGFIRKVFAIFGAQMTTTIAVTYFIMRNSDVASFLLQNYQPISIGSFIVSTGIILTLVNNPKLRYTFPNNILLLGMHTFLQSVMVGTFSSLMSPKAVCLGTVHTLAVFIAIALYTLQPYPQFDFSILGNALLATVTSLGVGVVLNLFLDMPVFDNILSGVLAVVFALYLLHDLSQIVGGQHRKYQYNQKEYILAALNLYQDAISMYMHIVKLLKDNEERSKHRKL